MQSSFILAPITRRYGSSSTCLQSSTAYSGMLLTLVFQKKGCMTAACSRMLRIKGFGPRIKLLHRSVRPEHSYDGEAITFADQTERWARKKTRVGTASGVGSFRKQIHHQPILRFLVSHSGYAITAFLLPDVYSLIVFGIWP